MLKFGNKEFRNLQEQVFKNMSDIATLKSSGIVLDEFGIKVVGQESSIANMPTVTDYKELNPDWAYGDAYAIGTEAPYELYILTREDANHESDYWFNIGEFPAPGPQGEQGPEGPQGPQGQTGNPGANGASAGFATPTATVTTLEPGSDATVSITASGPDTSKTFAFSFGIPEGQPGSDASAAWGNISGDIDDQTDLVNALQTKQNVLVSGTSIKTINNESLLGSGNITVAASTVDWDDIQDKPTFATVATSGSYNDLTNKPTIPAAQVNSDWNAVSGVAQILNKPSLATVATSGSYNDLTDKPTIPVVDYPVTDVQVDGTSVLSGTVAEITMPDLSIYAETADLGDCAYLDEDELSIAYSQITGTPSIPTNTSDLNNDSGFITSAALSGYATETWVGNQGYITGINSSDVITALGYTPGTSNFSGSYTDLTDKPSIPTKTSDLNNDSGFITKSVNDLTNYTLSSALATVATSGSYNDLSNKPTIPAAQVNADWDAESGVAQILNKPTLATVATSGSYNDLSNKPTIPTVPVQDVTVNGTSVLDGTTAKVVLQNVTFNTSEYSGGTTIKGIKVDNDYYNVGISPTVWGDISGTLSNQTDLQNALNAKADVSSLTGYATETWVGQQGYAVAANLATVATSGSYTDLSNTPTIPTDTSDLTNGAGFITSSALSGYATLAGGTQVSPQTFSGWNLFNNGITIQLDNLNQAVEYRSDQIIKHATNQASYGYSFPNDSGTLALTSDIPTNYVTTNTTQTITGTKNFTGYVYFDSNDDNHIYTDSTSENLIITSNSHDIELLPTNEVLIYGVRIDPNNDGYGLTAPNTNSWTADKTIATTDQLFSGSYNDLTDKPTIPTVPVQDVTVGGTSVVSSGTAVIPAIPDIYYKNGDTLTIADYYHLSGYITNGSKEITLAITTPKSLKNISSITVNKCECVFRGVGGYVNGSSAIDYASTSGYTISTYIPTENTIILMITKSTAYSSATNNTTICAAFAANNFSLTFNA